jgi:hypothetical protein
MGNRIDIDHKTRKYFLSRNRKDSGNLLCSFLWNIQQLLLALCNTCISKDKSGVNKIGQLARILAYISFHFYAIWNILYG